MTSDKEVLELVEFVINLLENYFEDETIINKIDENFTFEKCDSESVLELVRIGLFRASFISQNGFYPKNNLDNNLIVFNAKNIGLKKLGRPELCDTEIPKRKWWKFW